MYRLMDIPAFSKDGDNNIIPFTGIAWIIVYKNCTPFGCYKYMVGNTGSKKILLKSLQVREHP